MVTRQPDYNHSFRCIGGQCPDTCCRDWEIVLDEGALEDYRTAPQPLREQIAANLVEDGEGDLCFRLREDGYCALLTPDGLCPIQRDWGEGHLCAHCAAYPRFTEEYGSLTETALAISCPEAARLLMEQKRFVLTEWDDGVADQPFDGVDGELLAGLDTTRRLALELLNDDAKPLWQRLAELLAFADDVQDCIDFGAFSSMGDCVPEPVEVERPLSRRKFAVRLVDACGKLESLRPAWPALLERRGEELKGLDEDAYADLCQRFQRSCPGWERRLANLACYLVFRHWHKTVNDDGLYGRGALAGAACLLVYHLSLLAWREKGSLFPAEEALIWSAFSREVEHLEENLTDLIELLFHTEEWPLLSALCG